MRTLGLVFCLGISLIWAVTKSAEDVKDRNSPVRKSVQMCKKYAEAADTKDCNIDDKTVLKQVNTQPKEFPHSVQIGFGNETNIRWMCIGSLISESFVLGAAHCRTRDELPSWVKVGDYDTKSEKDEAEGLSRSVIYKVESVIAHPEYKERSYYNDIALVKVNKPVEFSEFVRPICLHTEDEPLSQYLTTTGYRKDEIRSNRNNILMKVSIAVVPGNECKEAYEPIGKNRLENGIDDKSMVCAVDIPNKHDVCLTESGSPMHQVHAEHPCMYSLVGSASFGKICGQSTPGVYNRVSHYVPWIESVVWP